MSGERLLVPSLAGFKRQTTHLPPPSPQQTLEWMVKLTRKAQFDQPLRGFAEKLISQLFPHDYLSEYAALLNWTRANVRYVRDPRMVEQVKSARAVYETRTADCDCMSVFIGSLAGMLGARVRYVAGAFKHGASREPILSHVWCEVYDPMSKAWVILDPVPGRRVEQMINKLVAIKVANAVE